MLKYFRKEQFFILCLVIFYVALLLNSLTKPFGEQHFSYLALSFLDGRLDLNMYPWIWDDTALYLGNHFWPLGLFPAFFLMPFVLTAKIFGFMFYQTYIQWVLVLIVFYLIYKIARKIGFNSTSSIFWALAFNVASVFFYVSLVPFSWYFSQVIVVLLLFLAFLEYLGKRRRLLIGLYYAAIFLTRSTAALGILFYVLSILLLEKKKIQEKSLDIIKLATPLFIALVIAGVYNLLRFGNFFELGYSYQVFGEELVKARSYGMFSLIHIPGNLYYLFFASPLPVLRDGLSRVLAFPYIKYDIWGLGIFYTSPYFLKLFTLKLKDKINKYLLLTSLAVSVPILLYYGIGVRQFGYRYSLDFIPYLFFILMNTYGSNILSKRFKALIVLSSFFNLYLLLV